MGAQVETGITSTVCIVFQLVGNKIVQQPVGTVSATFERRYRCDRVINGKL